MAEERLIDDDKDRKYKIVKNEDGEEELVIDYTPDETEEDDIPVFDMPDYAEDDEEAALLTPEQLAERERLRAEEERARAAKIASLTEKSRTALEESDFEKAFYLASQAEELDGENGAAHCLKLRALSHNLYDFTSLSECAEIADKVREYADDECKEELRSLSDGLKKRIEEVDSQADGIREINEQKKAERRTVFAQKSKRALKAFSITAVPFVLFLILAIAFSTVMFADENGAYLIVTIVCAALAFIALLATLFTANRLWSARRNVRLNEKDASTKLGREYLEIKGESDSLKRIFTAFN